MPISDSEANARLLLQRRLFELGLTPDLDEVDRQVAADQSLLQEIRGRFSTSMGSHSCEGRITEKGT